MTRERRGRPDGAMDPGDGAARWRGISWKGWSSRTQHPGTRRGGATGGGMSQVVPMEEINLHFTGDIHAISTAHNLISACIDNHLMQGNELDIDVNNITWKRVLDMNDRALRNIVVGMGGRLNGIPRETSFQITVASEIMAIFCLADSIVDLKKRIGKIVFPFQEMEYLDANLIFKL